MRLTAWPNQSMHRVVKKMLMGRYIVSDPKICHGQPTFLGTRILVADVLEQVASGMAWESIVAEWRGSISEGAIAEAVRAARETFQEHAQELALKPVAA
jgi:uncharacterized protein (DUF433 family)